MDKSLKESIDKFNRKHEFCKVKLKTRQSFKDQAAIEQSLSKYNFGRCTEMDTNEQIKYMYGIENKTLAVLNNQSQLDSTVSDIDIENDYLHIRNDSDIIDLDSDNEEMKTQSNEMGYIKSVQSIIMNENLILNSAETDSDGSAQPDSCDVQLTANGNQQNIQAPAYLLSTPVLNGFERTCLTSEPRMKLAKGIYHKNPKLTPGSTDHLDSIYVRSARQRQQQRQRIPIDYSPFDVSSVPAAEVTPVPPVPAAEAISIPDDGNLCAFSEEEMVTILSLLQLPSGLVYKFSTSKINGEKFSRLSDKKLNDLGINNPIIKYFRDRSAQKPKKNSSVFML